VISKNLTLPELLLPASRRRGGFTLVELLVVIGIIVLLFSIGTPMIISARRNAERVRTQGDLNTIAMALDAYKADFKDYPRPDVSNATEAARPVLAWALLGPWAAIPEGINPGDGADGPGFRTQWNNDLKVGGKVFGPYLPPDKFNTEIKDGAAYLLDRFGTRIEYFPRWRSAKPGIKLFGVSGGDPIAGLGGNGGGIYDWRQATPPRQEEQAELPPTTARLIYYLQRALGDGVGGTHDDLIGGGEKLLTDPPAFLLLSRGHSKIFSSKEAIDTNFDKTGEVTNLQMP
jgi:prepilin-type N-terminal cleavage/methylation domain-containing protein